MITRPAPTALLFLAAVSTAILLIAIVPVAFAQDSSPHTTTGPQQMDSRWPAGMSAKLDSCTDSDGVVHARGSVVIGGEDRVWPELAVGVLVAITGAQPREI